MRKVSLAGTRNAMDIAYGLGCLLTILMSPLLSETLAFVFVDYTENTELVQQRAGFDIRLQCDLKGLVDEKEAKDIKIHWFFKQCREKSVSTNDCRDWTQLPCEENFCKPDLLLRNVTEEYSGFYKCTVAPHQFQAGHSLDIQFVRTFQLDVKNKSMTVPEFVDSYPLNKTVAEGTQVVFQCRVHSEEHPTIRWFRRVPNSTGTEYISGNGNFNSHIVSHDGKTYELLPTAREKLISDELYLSKLIFNGARLQEEGFYACVAISYRGYKIREAYLEVSAPNDVEYWADYDASEEGYTDPRQFWLLFLMPLGLAMLPILVWLLYVIYKRCLSKVDARRKEQQYSDEFLEADRCMLNS